MPAALVIGVARDAQMVNLAEIPPVYVYAPSASGELLVATSGDLDALVSLIRQAARAIDPNILIAATPVSELIATNGSVYNVRFATGFAIAIGTLATTLAAVGIFGLMTFTVTQRSRELGIRMALGARGRDVVALVVRQGARVVVAGCAIGILLGLAATRLFRAMLFGMSALDPFAFGATALIAVTIAAVACYLPVRRAARIDPVVSLKAD